MKHSDPLNKDFKQAMDDMPVDKDVQQQLINARYLALDQQVKPSRSYFVPAVVFASLAILAVAITLNLKPVEDPISLDSIDAFEIITSRDELEMYQNLEFYLWLEDQPMENV